MFDCYMSEKSGQTVTDFTTENDVHGGNTNLNEDMIIAVVIAI